MYISQKVFDAFLYNLDFLIAVREYDQSFVPMELLPLVAESSHVALKRHIAADQRMPLPLLRTLCDDSDESVRDCAEYALQLRESQGE